MNIGQVLRENLEKLSRIQVPEARREAEVILTKVLGKERSFIFAFPETQLENAELERIRAVVQRRVDGEPLAYIFGAKEFWSLELAVNEQVLIPRADTECVVQAILDLPLPEDSRVIDLGTGSGAIALALATERPEWDVYASDLHLESLSVAQHNIAKYSKSAPYKRKSTASKNIVSLFAGDWLKAIAPEKFDLVVSNPPYIAMGDSEVAPLTLAEPDRALFSERDGLKDMAEIIGYAPSCLKDGAWLVLEHGARQQESVLELLNGSLLRSSVIDQSATPDTPTPNMPTKYVDVIGIKDFSGLDRGVAARVIKG